MRNHLQMLTESLQKFDKKELSIPEIALQFVQVFQQLQREAEKHSPGRNEKFITQFKETAQKLQGLVQPYVNAVSVGEEKLITALDAPNCFNEEEYKAVRNAQEQLRAIALTLLPHLIHPPQLDRQVPSSTKRKKHLRRADWLKS